MRMFLIPLNEQKLMIRFENLNDEAFSQQIDIKSIAAALWFDTNGQDLTELAA
jgi:hypothetical protein